MRGVDCSGLLYEATGGFTPRNTSALVTVWKSRPCCRSEHREIVGRLEPLDLIVWNGHVLIVLDRLRLIESRPDCTGKHGGYDPPASCRAGRNHAREDSDGLIRQRLQRDSS